MAGSLLYFFLLLEIQSTDKDSFFIIENNFWYICPFFQELF